MRSNNAPSEFDDGLGRAGCGRLATPIDSSLTALQREQVEGSSKHSSKRIKREHGRRLESVEAVAAPATVSGEPFASTDHWATGKVEQKVETREPGADARAGLLQDRRILDRGPSESYDT
jgi:hypothetical protein